jgi:hypothetical protein
MKRDNVTQLRIAQSSRESLPAKGREGSEPSIHANVFHLAHYRGALRLFV